MPSFQSPISKKNIVSSGEFKEVDIPDESISAQNPFDVDRLIQDPRMKRLNPDEIAAFSARVNHSEFQEQQNYQNIAELERSFKEAKQSRKMGYEPLSDGARKRLEVLIGMTRISRLATINGTTYELQTLKDREMREGLLKASEFDLTVESPFEIRKQLLARSLVSIGGLDIVSFVGSDKLEAKIALIEEMDHELLGRLYEEYLLMVRESKKKYAIKPESIDPKDAEGVVDALKK